MNGIMEVFPRGGSPILRGQQLPEHVSAEEASAT